jgi:hypothetical protein
VILTSGAARTHRTATPFCKSLRRRNLHGSEREELEALVELSERLSLLRAEALQILGKQP